MEKEKEPKLQEGKIEIGPLGKEGKKIVKSMEKGNLVAVLSGNEVMYLLRHRDQYLSFLHKMGEEEGRQKAWEINDRNKAMLDNLNSAADGIFEIRYDKSMDLMGVMVTAERGIYNFLCSIGKTPGEDLDFMDELDKALHPAPEGEGDEEAPPYDPTLGM